MCKRDVTASYLHDCCQDDQALETDDLIGCYLHPTHRKEDLIQEEAK